MEERIETIAEKYPFFVYTDGSEEDHILGKQDIIPCLLRKPQKKFFLMAIERYGHRRKVLVSLMARPLPRPPP